MYQHCSTIGRSVHVVNLDPAAEQFTYPCSIDISELITVEDVMTELDYGPNGGLLYCLEYLVQNMSWLRDKLEDHEEDYLIIDCPGQIELYTHAPVMKAIVDFLTKQMGYKIVCLYLLDANFLNEAAKFISGTLICLAAMIQFEQPHINLITKVDLLGKKAENEIMEKYYDANVEMIISELHKTTPEKFYALNEAFAQVIDDWSLVQFVPLNIQDEESIANVLAHIDNATQYGENEEPKEPIWKDEEDI
ncbi:GPN-loop GTPase 3-like isoform X2 [Schistocerca gregaria]|nr:GPN-loop GTPase 3-like isoform X2 [Schistocerca gregaria]